MSLPSYSDLRSDVYSIFPEPDKPIARYTVPGNGRRCQTCPPWSVTDIGRRFNLRIGPDGHPPPRFWVDPALLRPYRDVRVMLDWHDSLVLLLDGSRVMKMMSPLIDIHTVVQNMDRARQVVPVPQVHHWGRSGNCVFLIMDYIKGWQVSTVVRYFGPWVEVKLQDQIEDVIAKLAHVGLSHNDLYPRNIFVDDRWRIVGIIDWDYAAPLWASTEYERRSTLNLQEMAWHHLFLKHSADRLGCLGANPSDGEFKYHHKPPPGKIQRPDAPYTWAMPSPKRGEWANGESGRIYRIVALVSGSVHNLEHLATSSRTHALPNATLSLVISDRNADESFAELCNRISAHYVSYDPKHTPDFTHMVTRELIKAAPDVVLLMGWSHALTDDFWRAVLIPRTLSDFASFPPVLGIRASLPGHWIDQPDPVYAAYRGFALGFGARNTGCSAYRVFPYQEVEVRSEHAAIHEGESLTQFEARMRRTAQEFTISVLRHLLERLTRYSASKRLMDGRFYGDGPRSWNRNQPLADVFLYLSGS